MQVLQRRVGQDSVARCQDQAPLGAVKGAKGALTAARAIKGVDTAADLAKAAKTAVDWSKIAKMAGRGALAGAAESGVRGITSEKKLGEIGNK